MFMDTLFRIDFENLLVCTLCLLCCAACTTPENVTIGDSSGNSSLRSKDGTSTSASGTSTSTSRTSTDHAAPQSEQHSEGPSAKSTSAINQKNGDETDSLAKQIDFAAYKKCMCDIAAQMDETVEDGWFFGEEPRMFKSFYRKISPEQKAEFAVDYHKFISAFNQNLINDYKSYVPYSKRADFAMQWWSARVPRFNSSEMKMKVLWAHESIQDAGELWWRASEKLGKAPNDSVQLMAHDEEQRMVSHFTEKEGSPGTISDQVWKRTH